MHVVFPYMYSTISHFRSDAQRAAKQKEAKERELEHAAFSADRIEEGGFPPISMVSFLPSFLKKCAVHNNASQGTLEPNFQNF